ncbi:hypothetical protein F511_03479 [Dorcoceras hygrometricum]|uniref:Uncharacterized protein n=1 Tax=Dorcoceras hygrometricum TaxID=472368 RepID=A0A2Z7DHR8_9LAMI|nr:hypothetical protein F511_03479 [Dorcoceras hygrometricum]
MATCFFVSALQVEFESVLAMEHIGMVTMFKSLVDTRLEGFLAASSSVYEAVVVELFSNAKVIAGTIDLQVTKLDRLEPQLVDPNFLESHTGPENHTEKDNATLDRATVVQKLVDEHLENFKPDVPSVTYDYMCIRFLSRELKQIARQHRDLRVLAGLHIIAPKASFAGDGANIAIPKITLSEDKQAAGKKTAQTDEQFEEIVRTIEDIEEIETEKEQLGYLTGQQTTEQPAPVGRDKPQLSTRPSDSRYSGNSSHIGPSLTLSSTLHLETSPSKFHMIVYTEKEKGTPAYLSKRTPVLPRYECTEKAIRITEQRLEQNISKKTGFNQAEIPTKKRSSIFRNQIGRPAKLRMT